MPIAGTQDTHDANLGAILIAVADMPLSASEILLVRFRVFCASTKEVKVCVTEVGRIVGKASQVDVCALQESESILDSASHFCSFLFLSEICCFLSIIQTPKEILEEIDRLRNTERWFVELGL